MLSFQKGFKIMNIIDQAVLNENIESYDYDVLFDTDLKCEPSLDASCCCSTSCCCTAATSDPEAN